MCGLAGVASTERRKRDDARKSAFSQLLEAASWRGKDATGVAVTKILDLKMPSVVYKKAIKASDFIELDTYRRMMSRFDEYGYVIGHARSSTSDGWNLADANAHPFQYGPITLVHNGTIRNYRMLDSGMEHPVDSAHIAAAMENEDEPKEVLNKLAGPFACVWHDARDGTLNFAKNHEKPLYWCYIEKENTMFWGSELEAIYAVMVRHDYQIEGKFRIATSYHHFKFKLDDLRKFERVPFGKPPTRAATQSSQPGAPWKEELLRLPARSRNTASIRRQENSTQETKPATTSGSKSGVDATGVYDETKHSVRPKSRKKLRTVKERLQILGRALDQPVCFTPEYWVAHKNQKGGWGAIEGHDRVRGQKFQIANVPQDIWGRSLAAGTIYGRAVNVRKDSTIRNSYILVCDYAPDLMDRFVFKPTFQSTTTAPGGTEPLKPFPVERSPDPTIESLPESGAITLEEALSERRYLGPGDRKLTEKDFLVLVKHGCGFCQRDLEPANHEEILWVGPMMQTPICSVCSKSRDVRAHLGITSVERGE
jgi:hypothetical protein